MWNKIKKILSKQGEKCIIIEDNKPSYLVMKLEDDGSSETEEVNQSIAELRTQEKEEAELDDVVDKQKVEIEDLPF